jgi:DNA-binding MarR family transcriptional regulator
MQDIQLIELFIQITRKMIRLVIPVYKAENLSITEAIVLWRVYREQSYRTTELAETIGIPPSTMTGILDRLVSKKWLERVPDPEDRRVMLIVIRPQGTALVQQLIQTTKNEFSEAFDALSQKRNERLISDLKIILDHLEHR